MLCCSLLFSAIHFFGILDFILFYFLIMDDLVLFFSFKINSKKPLLKVNPKIEEKKNLLLESSLILLIIIYLQKIILF